MWVATRATLLFNLRLLGVLLLLGVAGRAQDEPAGSNAAGVRELTLDEAVSIALRQNPDILKAGQEIERTRGLVIEVRAQALPQVTLSSSYNQQDRNLQESSSSSGSSSSTSSQSSSSDASTSASTSSSSTSSDTSSSTSSQSSSSSGLSSQLSSTKVQNKSWNVTVQARQVIYSGGQVRSALKIARFQEDISYFQLMETVNTVIANVRKGFYEVLLNRELIGVQEESVQLLQQQLDDQTSRFDVGTVPRFNVLQAEVALANARPDLIRAQNAFLVSRLQLAKLLGIPSTLQTDVVTPPVDAVGRLETSRQPIPLSQALAQAKVQRPFLKVQRKTILSEAEGITQALAGYKPTVYASGGYTVRNSYLSDNLEETVNGWFFGFEGSWAIFDGLATYGKTKQAKARLQSAKINYDDSVMQVELEVQTALTQVQQARALVQSQAKNVEQAMEALRLATERLNAGAGTQLDVLDARVALTQARATEVQARYEYNVAIADFAQATGDATSYESGFDDPMVRAMKRE